MTPLRTCLTCGRLTRNGPRCPPCTKARDRDTGRTGRKTRLYKGSAYLAARRAWVPVVADGMVHCARCGQLIIGSFDLDHLDAGRLHPSHPACNRAAH